MSAYTDEMILESYLTLSGPDRALRDVVADVAMDMVDKAASQGEFGPADNYDTSEMEQAYAAYKRRIGQVLVDAGELV